MKTKLSDTQLVILSRACQREDRVFDHAAFHLKGGALQKVVGALVAKGLLEVDNTRGTLSVLRATDAAFEAVGIEMTSAGGRAEANPPAYTGTSELAADKTVQPDVAAAATPRRPRENTKQATLIAMLTEGATVDEIVKAIGWLPHTVRGAMAGALKRKLGLTIVSDNVEGRGRVYRIQAGGEAAMTSVLKTIRISDSTAMLLREAAIHPFTQTGERQPEGWWVIPIEEDTYARIEEHRANGETDDELVLRLLLVADPRLVN